MKKIVIVEDDNFLMELMARKLSVENFEVVSAFNGEEGLKKIKEEKPDFVLLDLVLPGIDGFEVLEKLKNDKETAGIPVVILSNLGQKDDIEKGFKLGAEDFLVKAYFTPGEIVEKIRAILKNIKPKSA